MNDITYILEGFLQESQIKDKLVSVYCSIIPLGSPSKRMLVKEKIK